jgi:hypothetical protein
MLKLKKHLQRELLCSYITVVPLSFCQRQSGRIALPLTSIFFLFPFFLVYLLFFSLLFSKGERNHRGTKKKVSPSTFARVSSFGFFLPEEENKRKKREEKGPEGV